MPVNIQELLLNDVQTVFDGVDANNANEILARLRGMTARLFAPFNPHAYDDLWIRRVWATGPGYGYEGFPGDELAFPVDGDQPQINPLTVQLANGDQIQDAFRYLFTSRDREDRKHWNASTRNGGYQVFPNGPDINAINQMFEGIRQIGGAALEDGVLSQALIQVQITKTVMMHLTWPYIFPTWYKEAQDGYSQIRGMTRLLSDVAYLSNDNIRAKDEINLYKNYLHYASVYRVLLSLYKIWVNGGGLVEHHFDFFTQFLAELSPLANPLNLLQIKKAIVLYGVPGTGKTHNAKQLAQSVTGQAAPHGQPGDAIKIVQFHPGYSYADFIVGIRPETTADGQVNYRTTKGVLYEWAERAANCPDQKFCMIIDEINRANLAEVLGEAMYCLEYRGDTNHIQLPQVIENDGGPFEGGRRFYLPCNLYVIGTMNHADRSISGFDMALRRRFAWYRMEPMTWIQGYLADQEFDQASLNSFLDAAIELNDRISNGQATSIPLNADHQIGDSYFAAIKEIVFPPAPENGGMPDARRILPQDRETLWLYYLRPLLEDYLGNDVHTYQDALKQLGEWFVGA